MSYLEYVLPANAQANLPHKQTVKGYFVQQIIIVIHIGKFLPKHLAKMNFSRERGRYRPQTPDTDSKLTWQVLRRFA